MGVEVGGAAIFSRGCVIKIRGGGAGVGEAAAAAVAAASLLFSLVESQVVEELLLLLLLLPSIKAAGLNCGQTHEGLKELD